MKCFKSIASLGLGAALALSATHALAEDSASAFAPLKAEIERQCEAGLFVGVALVQKGDQTLFSHQCGLADPANRTPMTLDTRFKIFSTSKSITALTLLSLSETGEISLDAPLSAYLPRLPSQWQAVTLRQLLNHSSGIGDYSDQVLIRFSQNHAATMDRLLDELATADQGLAYETGKDIAYNNFGFELAAHAASKAMGRGFGELIRERVLEPAGMTSTDVETEMLIGPHPLIRFDADVAIGYVGTPQALQLTGSYSYMQPGAGAVRSSANDMMKLARAIEDGRIVKPETLAEMSRNLIRKSDSGEFEAGQNAGLGLGLFVRNTVAGPDHFHTGGTNGYITSFGRFVDHDVAYVLMSARGFTDTEELDRKVAEGVAAAVAR
ncbi:serine hydrolase domain-containing protein [uncultured Brevundimonas sp.]|uniref:serine hydrolase domain-containing protein n=1 Tax=uncultured Brevundimonas sp. TaxID=213418 RepID=UPI00260AB81E|nr:serine hydrolase domain-containing protein [uncultured Brevundimonas sp.]